MANHTITETAEYKHFLINVLEQEPRKKSRRYIVRNHNSWRAIAFIKWYAPWRQYCFSPAPETVWSSGCLADIQQFLDRLNEKKPKKG